MTDLFEDDIFFNRSGSNRSGVQELEDYIAWAVTDLENRMFSILLDVPQPDNPFKSLDYYDMEDASIFFGRSTATRELFDKAVDNRLSILYARSGAGKSSILNAGLSPRLLQDGRLPIYVRVHPFQEDLVQEIKQSMFPPSLRPWPKLLARLTLQEFLGLVCTKRSRRTRELVIILDQFEQFLISLPDETIRQSFIDSLRDCHKDHALSVRFLISLKHENLGDLDTFEAYIPGILQNRYRLPSMTEMDVKEAITGPVQRVRPDIGFEPELLEKLIRELGGKNAELTHLQIVCSQLYSALPEGQRVITISLYEELGGAEKILANYLDRTIEPLPEYKQKITRTILMELVSSEGTDRTLRLSDIQQALPPEPGMIEEVLDYLVSNRLLRRRSNQGEEEYELAHAYLAEEISHMVDREQLENKRARDLLERELVNWRLFHIGIEPEKLDYLRAHFQSLTLDAEACDLLFESSLEHRYDLGFWIDQMPDRRAAARSAASAALRDKTIAESLRTELAGDLQADVLVVLWRAYNLPGSSQKQQAAEALWILKDWLSAKEMNSLRRMPIARARGMLQDWLSKREANPQKKLTSSRAGEMAREQVISKRQLKVFLCHAHSDQDKVRKLYSRLVPEGIDAWLDKEKLLAGSDWDREIRRAVREADLVIVCLSKQFNQAGYRQKEVRLALDSAMEKPEGEIFIIPARLEECDILESLRKWHCVDLFEEDGYHNLMRALRVRAESIAKI